VEVKLESAFITGEQLECVMCGSAGRFDNLRLGNSGNKFHVHFICIECGSVYFGELDMADMITSADIVFSDE
jgi:hypothetical protein